MASLKKHFRQIDLSTDFRSLRSIINWILFVLTLGLVVRAIHDIGFSDLKGTIELQIRNHFFHVSYVIIGFLYLVRSIFFKGSTGNRKVFIAQLVIGIMLILFFFPLLLITLNETLEYYFYQRSAVQMLAFFLFFLELSRMEVGKLVKILNPAQLFMMSFALIIFTGAMFLMMPMSTTVPITFTDALFTSTSAVCVTGLVVVDTATRFTFLGKFIVLTLIQIGGIGVMTITSFFGIFFKEKSSLREQTMLRDYLGEDSFDAIIKSLMKVVLIVLLVEAIGALFIYWSLGDHTFSTTGERIRFSVFHAISAFCNAGFSTLTDNLYDIRIRTNYGVQVWVANLIVLGGIGFPILLNIYHYCKNQIKSFFEYITKRQPYSHQVNMISLNSKIVIFTTFILIVFGTLSFLYFEKDYTQQGLDYKGRLAMSYFQSISPRTAGFNNCSMSALSMPTVLITIFLMWVGASPVSAGGGIKTSTFALAILNTIRIMKGKTHIEINRYEIHEYSVNKAFAIIIISIFTITIGSFGIYSFDGQHGMLRIIFECVSAFGTVGLSLDLTPKLTSESKYILIILMYIGRMGSITLLLSMVKDIAKISLYRYPKENLIIT